MRPRGLRGAVAHSSRRARAYIRPAACSSQEQISMAQPSDGERSRRQEVAIRYFGLFPRSYTSRKPYDRKGRMWNLSRLGESEQTGVGAKVHKVWSGKTSEGETPAAMTCAITAGSISNHNDLLTTRAQSRVEATYHEEGRHCEPRVRRSVISEEERDWKQHQGHQERERSHLVILSRPKEAVPQRPNPSSKTPNGQAGRYDTRHSPFASHMILSFNLYHFSRSVQAVLDASTDVPSSTLRTFSCFKSTNKAAGRVGRGQVFPSPFSSK